ncbi:hypothetical protein POTOM_010237 [Populus tomentosa]|uniref:Uncharacterized protein n=1 Tax=Populus tomentosa TaxID=118781 RepID=A0A8X8APE3_POPTO|nr:hypothetical protein POTOM_010237 [Populus tomentosa]
MGGDFVCYTLLYARNPHDSNRWFRIQVETWDDMAKLCFQHLKPKPIWRLTSRFLAMEIQSPVIRFPI